MMLHMMKRKYFMTQVLELISKFKLKCLWMLIKCTSFQPKNNKGWTIQNAIYRPVASFTKEVNERLAKRPLKPKGV